MSSLWNFSFTTYADRGRMEMSPGLPSDRNKGSAIPTRRPVVRVLWLRPPAATPPTLLPLHRIRRSGSRSAVTKEVIHSFGYVGPSGGALVVLRGAARQEIVVVRIGRAGSRVRAPSSNIYVLTQVAVAAGAVVKVAVVVVVAGRHPVVHQQQPGQLVLLVGGLAPPQSHRPLATTTTAAALVVAYVGHVHRTAAALAATAQVVHVDVPTSPARIIVCINDQLRGAVAAGGAAHVVVVRVGDEKALVLVLVRRGALAAGTAAAVPIRGHVQTVGPITDAVRPVAAVAARHRRLGADDAHPEIVQILQFRGVRGALQITAARRMLVLDVGNVAELLREEQLVVEILGRLGLRVAEIHVLVGGGGGGG